jgi:TolB-like protein/DNA-binding SARP family transcriptional activator
MTTASDLGNGTEGPARWSLRLFGGFEFSMLLTGKKLALAGKRERVLLACLALSVNSRQPRRKLATLLWGDSDDETALDNLRTTIWRLRKALGDTEHRFIASDGEDVALDSTAFEVDALAFRRLADQRGPRELELATNLYAGELLYGLDIKNEEFEAWRRAEAARYREQAVEVLTRLMQHFEELGVRERAIETGIRILQLEPLNEAVVRRLMRLYTGNGRRGAAVQLYRTLADLLRTDLDGEPEAETRSVHAEIARGGEEGTAAPAGGDAKPLPRPTTVTRPSDLSSALGQTKRGMRGGVAAVALAALIALFLFYQFAPWAGGETGSRETGAISVAVLPFVNLSGDSGQDFLSDGMTEEITAALAKVSGLRVVARTSAFEFKGQSRDVQAIGQQLRATYLIEGSLRKASDRLRITAQLIEVISGLHIWTQSYDRELTDIFALQEDIARAIAASLRVPLGLEPGENLVSSRSIDPESYQLFLQARALWTARGQENLTDAQRMLEQVTARNPNYAPGWAYLCAAHFILAADFTDVDPLTEDQRHSVEELLPKAETTCRHAIASDPSSAISYAAAGTLAWSNGRPLEGEELYSKALTLDPDDANLLGGYGGRLAVAGRLEHALPMILKSHALEPFAPVPAGWAATLLWLNGKDEEAIAQAQTLRPAARANTLARIYASSGRFAEAADALMGSPNANSAIIQETIHLLRNGPRQDLTSRSALLSFPGFEAGRVVGARAIDFLFLRAGVFEPVLKRVLDNLESRVDAGFVGGEVHYFWHPTYAPVRKTERFKAFLRKAGYVDYWRVKGWPDLCRPIGADDFVCE